MNKTKIETDHKYTKYRPKGCKHPIFWKGDYCWGLALAVDENTLEQHIKTFCKGEDIYAPCEFYKLKKELP